jgi:hypothetical protein
MVRLRATCRNHFLWPWRVWHKPGRCGQRDIGYYHALGQSMPCLRKAGHCGGHKNQWKETWK